MVDADRHRGQGAARLYWLDRRLELEPEWSERATDAADALTALGKLWARVCGRVDKYPNEAALEHAFIQPVFEALGWKPQYQVGLKGRKPDYALFLSDSDLDAALAADPKSDANWDHAAVVADAKHWDLPLAKKVGTGAKKEYPPEQIEWYLDRSRKPFGILTNGRLWRLVPREIGPHQRRFQTYYEADLAAILTDHAASGGSSYTAAEDFRRFFLFFGPAGHTAAGDRTPLIRRAVEGSSEYRLNVSETLEGQAFEALRVCIEGFLAHEPNQLDPGTDLESCRTNGFTLLCRLLFILFAEDRRLLPYRVNRTYTNNRSLGRVRDDIAERLDKAARGQSDDFSRTETGLWDDLTGLFDLIDKGKPIYGVPAYKRGLFNPDMQPFLSRRAVPDWHLARVVDQLGRALDSGDRVRVDYRDLAIQHLGGIYEGLLEQRPTRATVGMVVYTRKAKGVIEEKYVASTEPPPEGYVAANPPVVYAPGSVYLLNDKADRRAFGSYYTPDHIVRHIIGQTLDPVCDQITRDTVADIDATRAANAPAGVVEELDGSFPERLLKLRVLDPSMGSGHFLIAACQYHAEQIATNPYTPPGPDTGTADDTLAFWKRAVVENCLYGVDLNPLAVELARLAMWLETVARDRPLTFLDHHLKHGNSLIGARLADLPALAGTGDLIGAALTPAFGRRLPALIEPLAEIRNTPSDTLVTVKQKEKSYTAYLRAVEPFRRLADLWTADAAGRPVDPALYGEAADTTDKPVKFREVAACEAFVGPATYAAKLAASHWDLAFPEVFCGADGAGFDAVIGNPPYEVLSELESGIDPTDLKTFVNAVPAYRPAIRGKHNLYKLFICRALDVLRVGGRLGFIVPMPLLGGDQAAGLRKHMAAAGGFTAIDAFPQKDDASRRVFDDAKLSTVVFTYRKDPAAAAERFPCRYHSADVVEDIPAGILHPTTADLAEYDPENLTIVSCDQADWDIAVRLMKSGRMTRLGPHCTSYQGEVNETADKGRSISYTPSGDPLVLRGANVCQYLLRDASQGEQVFLNVRNFLEGKKEGSKAFAHRQRRIGFQRKSRQNNFRRRCRAEPSPHLPSPAR